MARPIKWRQINNIPEIKNFIPSDALQNSVQKNTLKLEEIEAIRLKDLEGLEQGECAQEMQISRPTFRRILISAREKIADSLIHGKAITIEGGNFTRNICLMHCRFCGHTWNESYENVTAKNQETLICPKCGSTDTHCNMNEQNSFCNGRCRRHGRHKI